MAVNQSLLYVTGLKNWPNCPAQELKFELKPNINDTLMQCPET